MHNDVCYSGCESAKSISPLWEMYVLLVPASLIPRPSGIMRVGTGPALVILDGLGTSLGAHNLCFLTTELLPYLYRNARSITIKIVWLYCDNRTIDTIAQPMYMHASWLVRTKRLVANEAAVEVLGVCCNCHFSMYDTTDLTGSVP